MAARAAKRILMISTHGYVAAEPEFGKPDTGGQVVYVLELSRNLARLGYQVDIATRRFEGQPAMEKVDDRVRVLRFGCGGKDFIPKETLCEHIPEWVENAAEHFAKKKLSYQFINSHYWDAGLAGQALSNRLGVPHLFTPHSIGTWKRDQMDGDPQELEAKYNFAHRIREEKTVFDECDAVIATTGQQYELITGDAYDTPPGKVAVVPPGYDDTRFYPVSRASRNALKEEYDAAGPTVMALGRLARNKGYDLLLKAMPAVFDRVKDAKLILAVGSDELNEQERELQAELEEIAADLGIEDRVEFRGYVPDDQLADYYRIADVFTLCSRYEPFGMTAVEAMAVGTPTVVTTEGGLWPLLVWGLEALYANPFDPDAYGHAIAQILTHQRVSDQLAKYGSQKARAKFTWTGVAQQVLHLLNHVERPPRPETAPSVGLGSHAGAAPPLIAEDASDGPPMPAEPVLEALA
ncbi:glycosyltransferase [Alienimonas chondri]|uniref:Mannosylfructose-phosphate synthase n=1 Tax=Alienimonas chondri TaxID=2681879 RepID=A0ABX1VG24_9PLAN|nr:glycosyltransferase [Alienimonas chondri]NNJ26495.1 Mannosylfructose-phosphate synthase [Alienimonas chondri]